MKNLEKEEIKNLPSQYRPMGAWSYFVYQILFAIPLIGFICLIVFSLDSTNIVRRSFARSYFCLFILIVIVIVVLIGIGIGTSLFDDLRSALNL